MAKQTIKLGTVPDNNTGDALRDGGVKINSNFSELYEAGDVDSRQYTSNISPPTYKEGLVFYDNQKKSLSYYNDEPNTTVNVGQETIVKVFNNNGSTLDNGTIVRVDTGVTAGVPNVVKSIADTLNHALVAVIVPHAIAQAETG